MPDVWAAVADLDAETQERLASVLETRGAEPQQRSLRHAFLSQVAFPPAARVLEVGQRALSTPPDRSLDPATDAGRANLAIIAETCHRLDGLPLAIELAAAQAQVLSPAAVLALMKQAGLPLLAGGGRDQPERLQTMDAAIAWSYNLLPAAEQALFRALSVFAGGFSLPAAAAVTPAASVAPQPGPTRPFDPRDPLAGIEPAFLRAIASLARQHVIFQDTTVPDHAAPRFRMLEPIRLFALDRLREAGEEPAARLRHARFFTALAEALDPLTLGADPEIWLRQQAIDFDNFRAAQDWALHVGEHDLVVRIVCSIAQLWELWGLLSEARQRVSQAIAVDAAATPANRWFLRFWAGTFALDVGDVAGAAAYARELLEIARTHQDPVGTGVGLALLSRAIGAEPDRHGEAAELARQAVETLEPLAQDEWTGLAWVRLGIESHRLGRLEEARDCLRRALEVRQRKSCAGCVSYTLAALGAVWLDLGEPEAALDAYLESLDLALAHENQTLLVAVLLGLADVAWRCGDGPDRVGTALRLFGAADALYRRHGFAREEAAREAIARWQMPMRRTVGDREMARLIAEGTELPLPEVVASAETLHIGAHGCREGEARQDEAFSLAASLKSIE